MLPDRSVHTVVLYEKLRTNVAFTERCEVLILARKSTTQLYTYQHKHTHTCMCVCMQTKRSACKRVLTLGVKREQTWKYYL